MTTLTISLAMQRVGRRLGPLCSAYGNRNAFVVHEPTADPESELSQLEEGDYWVVACRRCRFLKSRVIANLD